MKKEKEGVDMGWVDTFYHWIEFMETLGDPGRLKESPSKVLMGSEFGKLIHRPKWLSDFFIIIIINNTIDHRRVVPIPSPPYYHSTAKWLWAFKRSASPRHSFVHHQVFMNWWAIEWHWLDVIKSPIKLITIEWLQPTLTLALSMSPGTVAGVLGCKTPRNNDGWAGLLWGILAPVTENGRA